MAQEFPQEEGTWPRPARLPPGSCFPRSHIGGFSTRTLFWEGSSLCGRNKPSEVALNAPWRGARSPGKETLGACFNLVVLKCSAAIKQLKIKQNQSLGLVGQARQTRGYKLFPMGNARARLGMGMVISWFESGEIHPGETQVLDLGAGKGRERELMTEFPGLSQCTPSQGIPSSPCLSWALSIPDVDALFPWILLSMEGSGGSCA